jgi:IclR family transcriptional regulator, acetate operon repressor
MLHPDIGEGHPLAQDKFSAYENVFEHIKKGFDVVPPEDQMRRMQEQLSHVASEDPAGPAPGNLERSPVRPNGKSTADGGAKGGGGIQSVRRAFRILDVIASSGGDASLTEISSLSGIKISTCHHLLTTLIQAGYAAKQRGSRSYVLGSRILGLSTMCLKQVNLPRQAQRVIEMLNVRTKEAVQIAVLQGDDLVTVMRKETLHAVRVDAGTLGKSNAAHATATGKAILAWLPEAELARLVEVKGLHAFTPNTITDFQTLIEELRIVRRLGFAADREEFQNDVCCIGAPIRTPSGTVLGSISVSCPQFRADQQILESIRSQVVAAAQKLSADLAGDTSGPQIA